VFIASIQVRQVRRWAVGLTPTRWRKVVAKWLGVENPTGTVTFRVNDDQVTEMRITA
jgi:hypothetical protein